MKNAKSAPLTRPAGDAGCVGGRLGYAELLVPGTTVRNYCVAASIHLWASVRAKGSRGGARILSGILIWASSFAAVSKLESGHETFVEDEEFEIS